jgi:hypothetical protein
MPHKLGAKVFGTFGPLIVETQIVQVSYPISFRFNKPPDMAEAARIYRETGIFVFYGLKHTSPEIKFSWSPQWFYEHPSPNDTFDYEIDDYEVFIQYYERWEEKPMREFLTEEDFKKGRAKKKAIHFTQDTDIGALCPAADEVSVGNVFVVARGFSGNGDYHDDFYPSLKAALASKEVPTRDEFYKKDKADRDLYAYDDLCYSRKRTNVNVKNRLKHMSGHEGKHYLKIAPGVCV